MPVNHHLMFCIWVFFPYSLFSVRVKSWTPGFNFWNVDMESSFAAMFPFSPLLYCLWRKLIKKEMAEGIYGIWHDCNDHYALSIIFVLVSYSFNWRSELSLMISSWIFYILPLWYTCICSAWNLRQTKHRKLRRWKSSTTYFLLWWLEVLKVLDVLIFFLIFLCT